MSLGDFKGSYNGETEDEGGLLSNATTEDESDGVSEEESSLSHAEDKNELSTVRIVSDVDDFHDVPELRKFLDSLNREIHEKGIAFSSVQELGNTPQPSPKYRKSSSRHRKSSTSNSSSSLGTRQKPARRKPRTTRKYSPSLEPREENHTPVLGFAPSRQLTRQKPRTPSNQPPSARRSSRRRSSNTSKSDGGTRYTYSSEQIICTCVNTTVDSISELYTLFRQFRILLHTFCWYHKLDVTADRAIDKLDSIISNDYKDIKLQRYLKKINALIEKIPGTIDIHIRARTRKVRIQVTKSPNNLLSQIKDTLSARPIPNLLVKPTSEKAAARREIISDLSEALENLEKSMTKTTGANIGTSLRKKLGARFQKLLSKEPDANLGMSLTKRTDMLCGIATPSEDLPDIVTWRLDPTCSLDKWKTVVSVVENTLGKGSVSEVAAPPDKDTRKMVAAAKLGPGKKRRGVTKLWLYFEGPFGLKKSQATGWLARPNVVVTAGHCVLSKPHGRLVAVEAFVAYGAKRPVMRRGKRVALHGGWYRSFSVEHDIAAILLEGSFGEKDALPFIDTPVHTAVEVPAFSTDKDNGQHMYFDKGDARLAKNESLVKYELSTAEGASGAPIINEKDEVIGTHTGGECQIDDSSGVPLNYGIAINSTTNRLDPIVDSFEHIIRDAAEAADTSNTLRRYVLQFDNDDDDDKILYRLSCKWEEPWR